jgi:hypothetical protein
VSEDREGDSPERPSGGGSSGDLSRSQKRIKELVEAIDAAGDGEDVSREIDDLDYQLSITGETEIEDLRSRMSEDWGRALEEARERAERSRGRGR